MTSINLVLWY